MSARLVFAGLAAFSGAVAASVWLKIKPRTTPEARERQRRMRLNEGGRLVDGVITSVADSTLYYNYEVSGVAYSTSQDVSSLREYLPEDPDRLVGPVTVKYSTKYPADSMVVCESWSGLRLKIRERRA